MKAPVRVAITGAAGHIGYSLIFRIATGEMLGPDQPVILHLLEITPAMKVLEGVAMEVEDCACPLIAGYVLTDNVDRAFTDVDYALLVGARPRGPGMERSDLLAANGGIFRVQGKSLNDHASRDVRVVIVGNPANTNAHTAMLSAPDLGPRNFTAMTRLDHNRALAQLAAKTGSSVSEIRRMIIWGNHSLTQYPDIRFATIGGRPAKDRVEQDWYVKEYIPRVARRGTEIIETRGASSAASAANAIIDHMHDWALGTAAGDWTSMIVQGDGSYGIPETLMYSFPVTCKDGDYAIVQGLDIDEFSRARMDATRKELEEERDAVAKLLG